MWQGVSPASKYGRAANRWVPVDRLPGRDKTYFAGQLLIFDQLFRVEQSKFRAKNLLTAK